MSVEKIARALGLRRSGHEFVGACPSCGYRAGFSVTEKNGQLLVYCAAGGCEQAALWGALVKQGLVRDRGEQRAPRRRRIAAKPQGAVSGKTEDGEATEAERIEWARQLWQRTGPAGFGASGAYSIVGDYLISRAITIEIPDVIRFLPRCKHRDGAVGPAMVGRVDHVEHGSVAVHRTWLRPDGR
jgi:putative DNA primase/helicase